MSRGGLGRPAVDQFPRASQENKIVKLGEGVRAGAVQVHHHGQPSFFDILWTTTKAGQLQEVLAVGRREGKGYLFEVLHILRGIVGGEAVQRIVSVQDQWISHKLGEEEDQTFIEPANSRVNRASSHLCFGEAVKAKVMTV